MELYEELKKDAANQGNGGGEAKRGGISRMINTQAEYIMVLNANEPKMISQMNLDVIYVRMCLLMNLLSRAKSILRIPKT